MHMINHKQVAASQLYILLSLVNTACRVAAVMLEYIQLASGIWHTALDMHGLFT